MFYISLIFSAVENSYLKTRTSLEEFNIHHSDDKRIATLQVERIGKTQNEIGNNLLDSALLPSPVQSELSSFELLVKLAQQNNTHNVSSNPC